MIGYADGGCRRNPGGPATYGWLIEHADGRYVAHGKGLIPPDGRVTNNVAEYAALLALLEYANEHALRLREVRMDSRLVVRQVTGRWRCKAPHLRPLRTRACELLNGTDIAWIPRSRNQAADALAREAWTEEGPIPHDSLFHSTLISVFGGMNARSVRDDPVSINQALEHEAARADDAEKTVR